MDTFSLKILRMYDSRATLSISQLSAVFDVPALDLSEYVTRLRRKSYIRVESNYAVLHEITSASPIEIDTPLEITIDGKEAVETANQLDKQRRNDLIRYVITTAIAVAAFIKSFFF